MRGVSIGIDIGTRSVTTLIARHDKDGRLRILGLARADTDGVRRGLIISPEAFAVSLKKSATEASKMAGFGVKRAVVTFGGAGVRSSFSRGVVAISRADGEITADDMRRALQGAEALHPKNANREIIHIIPREYWVDGEGGIKNPAGMVGMRLEAEALIIEGQKQSLQNIMKAFDLAGIEIEEWIFSPLASAGAVLTKEQKELGVLLLDIGAGTSDYAIFHEGEPIDAGVIPIGGERITHDIAIGFKTRIDAAEAVKQKYGHILPGAFSKQDVIKLAEFAEDDTEVYSQRELGDIIQARLTDIFELAEKTLKQSGQRSLLPAGVVLIGGSSRIPGIREFAKREMRLPVERGVVQSRLSDEEGAESDGFIPAGADISPAVGSVLWHLNQGGGLMYPGAAMHLSGTMSFIKNWLRIFLP